MTTDPDGAKPSPLLLAALFGDGSLDDIPSPADAVSPAGSSTATRHRHVQASDALITPHVPATPLTSDAGITSATSIPPPGADAAIALSDACADPGLDLVPRPPNPPLPKPPDAPYSPELGLAGETLWSDRSTDSQSLALQEASVSYDLGSSWLDLDISPLGDGDMWSDPVRETDRLLQAEGIGAGSDFHDILEFLPDALLAPSILYRCLPGLEAKWGRVGHLMTDALQCLGKALVPEPSATLLPLVAATDALPTAIEDCPLDPFTLYVHEVQALRLLTHAEQRVLGQWIADGRYLAQHGLPSTADIDAETASQLLGRLLATLARCWAILLQALPARPSTAAGWRAALVAVSMVGASEAQVARIAKALCRTDDEVRNDLREAETILRLLPDATLARLADQLTHSGKPVVACTGRDIAAFAAECARRLHSGRVATDVLVRHSLRLVAAIAKPYAHELNSMELSDLVQEGAIGLMRAVERWDPYRGFAFSTYATWWIKQAVTRAIADSDLTVRLPVYMLEQVRSAIKDDELGPPHRGELLSLDAEDARAVLLLSRSATAREERIQRLHQAGIAVPLAATVVGALAPDPLDGDVGALAEEIADESPYSDPEQAGANAELRGWIYWAFDSLPARQRRVLELRYGFDDGVYRTLEQVGREFGITRERIRQLEAKAIKRLRHLTRSAGLRPFWQPESHRKRRRLEQRGKSSWGTRAGATPQANRRVGPRSTSGPVVSAKSAAHTEHAPRPVAGGIQTRAEISRFVTEVLNRGPRLNKAELAREARRDMSPGAQGASATAASKRKQDRPPRASAIQRQPLQPPADATDSRHDSITTRAEISRFVMEILNRGPLLNVVAEPRQVNRNVTNVGQDIPATTTIKRGKGSTQQTGTIRGQSITQAGCAGSSHPDSIQTRAEISCFVMEVLNRSPLRGQ